MAEWEGEGGPAGRPLLWAAPGNREVADWGTIRLGGCPNEDFAVLHGWSAGATVRAARSGLQAIGAG